MLLERFEDIQLGAGRPRYKQNIVLRGLEALPIEVSRRADGGAVAAG